MTRSRQDSQDGQGRALSETSGTRQPAGTSEKARLGRPSETVVDGQGTLYESTCVPEISTPTPPQLSESGYRDVQGRENTKVRVRAHTPAGGLPERDGPDRPCVPAFRTWIASLRDRGIVLTPLAVGFQIDGPADDHDHLMAARHDVALRAASSHRAWWDAVLGRAPITPDIQIPTVRDDQAVDGIGWPCTTCARPAEHLAEDLLPWCTRHRPEEDVT